MHWRVRAGDVHVLPAGLPSPGAAGRALQQQLDPGEVRRRAMEEFSKSFRQGKPLQVHPGEGARPGTQNCLFVCCCCCCLFVFCLF